MAEPNERICCPPPADELQRRWDSVRAWMREAKLDALAIQGAHGFSAGGGYFRWFTGTPSPTSYAQTAIFPRDGLITLVHHGDLDGEIAHNGANPDHPGVGKRLTTASFPAVHYTAGYDAEIAAREIAKAGYRALGLVGADTAYHGFMARLKALLGGVALVDATDAIDRIKAVKSAYDIAAIRRSAAMQDAIFTRVRAHIRPGMKDFEVMAYGHYVGQLLGSEQGYFLGSSAPAGDGAALRLRPHQGRTIRDGDVLMFQAENSGPDGFYVHMCRPFVLGKAPQELRDAFAAAVEAQHHTLKSLKPGTPCREAFAAHNAYMRARGFAEERRLHCHGQGYETVERPLIRHDETMAIAGTMNIGIHPSLVAGRTFMTVSDNFLIHPDGAAERLHQTPQEIIEL
jgi:Xaa-Pro aminopeptidase